MASDFVIYHTTVSSAAFIVYLYSLIKTKIKLNKRDIDGQKGVTKMFNNRAEHDGVHLLRFNKKKILLI